jgi:serine/threonine protein kinase
MAASLTLKSGLEPYPGYRLRQYLGGGAFGEVWESDKSGARAVALKFLYLTNGAGAPREIRILQNIRGIQHDNLVRLDQIWTYGGFVVYEMELAEGSLLDLFEAYQEEFHTPVPPAKACVYLSQAAEALDFLNARRHRIEGKRVGIQHCDIKPSNMLLFGDNVKLADFGLMSLTTAPVQAHRRGGTVDYMAPEQFQGRISDWTDQYALAVSYCLIRGGDVPFPDSPQKIEPGYERPEPKLSMLPENERAIVARALNRVPHGRWPTCADFMKALTEQVT